MAQPQEFQTTINETTPLTITSTENVKVYESFQDMGLRMEILRAIFALGYERPSSIQQRAIVPCYEGRDCVLQAQSGTGKTATFSIACAERVYHSFLLDPVHKCRAIILSPTRELATQSHSVISDLTKHCQLTCKALVGGRNVRDNINDMREGVDIVVGTPGRVLHLINEKYLCLDSLLIMVLDEADEMLSKGFRNDMCMLIAKMPPKGQIVLVSATLPDEVLELSEKFLLKPFRVLVNRTELSLSGITQFYVNVDNQESKFDVLKMIYDNVSISKAVIFCNSIATVNGVCESLKAQKYPVESMHGQMEQTERDRVICAFRGENCRVLVSSDLLSRGLDLQHVNLVVNYDVPNDRQSYLHRIGRSGRYGRKGTAINFVCEADKRLLGDIQEYYGVTICELPNTIEL